MNNNNEWVTSELLSFFPNTDDVLAEIRKFGQENSVNVLLEASAGTHEGYQIKLVGYRGAVEACIKKWWTEGHCFGEEEADAYVSMMLGSELGAHRFETGCTIESGNAWNYSKYQWDTHWEAAGVKSGHRSEYYDAAMEAAIELLATVGYEPSSDDEGPVDFAQCYLALAYLHCPRLMPGTIIRAASVEEAIEALRPVGWEPPTKQPSYDGVMLDAFNLFEGAAFQLLENKAVFVVMNFQDLGGTARDEHVKVVCRQADTDEAINVQEFVLDYNDKVILHGNVRNKFDFDDNNWGQN